MTRAVDNSLLFDRLSVVSIPARKLFAVIVRETLHGPIHPKPKGVATPPEILEACGLDVGEFYSLLKSLTEAGLIRVSNTYPFEEIELAPDVEGADSLAQQCADENVPVDDIFVNLASRTRNRG